MAIELKDIIKNELLHPVYQPIFDLVTGDIFGYEGLIRGPKDSCFHTPYSLFQAAEKENSLIEIDYLARKIVIFNYRLNKKLFVNVHASIFENEATRIGYTNVLINTAGLKSDNVIIELTEYSNVNNKKLCDKVNYYRQKKFQIAIDDFGIGNSDMKRFIEIHPNILKLDKSLIDNIEQNHFKREIVKAFVQLAQSNGIKTVAEGVENQQTLKILITLGVDYAQGYYLSKELLHPVDEIKEATEQIKNLSMKKRFDSITNSMNATILKHDDKAYHQDTLISIIDTFFTDNQNLRSLAVVNDDNQPVGIITRYKLNTMLSRQYGREIFMKKTVGQLMDCEPLIVDSNISIYDLSELAMNRDADKIYQDVIITESDKRKYYGIITIKDLLDHSIKLERDRVKNVNPLTNLPGNSCITKKLNTLNQLYEICIMYFDLDNFSYFNNSFDFTLDDKVILGLANVLEKNIFHDANTQNFLGHIGDDNFIAITSINLNGVEKLCNKINNEFHEFIHNLLPQQDSLTISNVSTVCIYINTPNQDLTAKIISERVAKLKKQVKRNQSENTYIIDFI